MTLISLSGVVGLKWTMKSGCSFPFAWSCLMKCSKKSKSVESSFDKILGLRKGTFAPYFCAIDEISVESVETYVSSIKFESLLATTE
jgi:hypothetical protein